MRSNKALVVALLLSGCSLAPDYQRPGVAAPSTFMEVPTGWTTAAPAADAPPAAWWQAFGDPVLNALESRIETDNPSLAAAVARYDEAVGTLREARAQLYPQIDANGSAQRVRAPANRPLTVPGTASAGTVDYNEYQVGASLSWEIDLFGRVRNTIAANRADAAASAADVAGIRLGLQASLATAYFQMRGLDAREGLLAQTVAAYQRAYDLTITRHDGGIGTGLDVSRARTQLASARAEVSEVRQQRAAYEHAVAVFAGESPSSLAIAVDTHQSMAPAFPANTPSTLLQRRPDIDAAERRVFSANARIGVARAALYPTISLGGNAGQETTGPNLLGAASSFWALGPASLAFNLFDGGARKARVRIARAQFDEASANYKQTVLTAFREVEDDLALGRDLLQETRDQQDAAASADKTLDLALIRYRDGASDYLEVVTAQTAALDAERTLLGLQTRQLTTAVDSVRALGGVAN
jgi:multidrug efflux system outer membrane protein